MRESGKMAVCVGVSVSVRDSEAVTREESGARPQRGVDSLRDVTARPTPSPRKGVVTSSPADAGLRARVRACSAQPRLCSAGGREPFAPR